MKASLAMMEASLAEMQPAVPNRSPRLTLPSLTLCWLQVYDKSHTALPALFRHGAFGAHARSLALGEARAGFRPA